MLEVGKIYQVGNVYLRLRNVDIRMSPVEVPNNTYEFEEVAPPVNIDAVSWLEMIERSQIDNIVSPRLFSRHMNAPTEPDSSGNIRGFRSRIGIFEDVPYASDEDLSQFIQEANTMASNGEAANQTNTENWLNLINDV